MKQLRISRLKTFLLLVTVLLLGLTSACSLGKDDALIEAARKGDTAKVKTLLAEGAEVNHQDQYGYTALIWAANKGHAEVEKHLLAEGADVNLKNKNGKTALSVATNKEVIQLLKAAGARDGAAG